MEQKIKIITYRGKDGQPGKDAPDLTPLFKELEVSLRNLIASNESNFKSNVEDVKAIFESYQSSQNLANGIVDGDLRDIETKVNELITLMDSKASKEELSGKSDLSALNQLQSDLLRTIENINVTYATKKELKTLESDLKKIIPAPLSVVSGSDNVRVTKDENTFKIAVDVPEITREVTKEIEVRGGGGISKATVQKMIDSAVEGIEISGGSGTVTDITSADGSIVVSPIAGGYDLSVTDKYVNVTGDTMTGTLAMSGAGIQLDLNHTPAHSEGKIFYDVENHTLAYYNDNSEITVNVGQEEVVRVRNNTGSTIANGKVVCIQGSSGNHPLIVLADNTDTSLSHSTLGVATHDINDNEDGYITISGLVNNLNTSMYSTEGVTLWLGTNGDVIETEPTAPIHKVKIGYLVRKHNNQGRILVAIDTGLDLDDLHNILIGDYEDGALLVASGAVWSPGANINDLATKSEVASISGALNNSIINEAIARGNADNNLYAALNVISGAADVRLDLLETIVVDANEPCGFVNRTDSSLNYNPATNQFAISGSYGVYVDGIKYLKTGDSATITPAYGTTFIKYDSAGAFSVSTSPWAIDGLNAQAAYVFFNDGATDSFLAEERHGIAMPADTHAWMHFTQGAKFKEGFAVGDYVLNSDVVANNKYSVATGKFYDEDILNTVSALADNGPYNIFYRTGALGNWTWSKTQAYPYFIDANSIRYNQFTGATWQLTNITTNNRWVNYYIFATNALTSNFGIVIIPGQSIFTSLANAQAESVASLSLGSLPFAEIVAVAKVTHQFSTAFDNANGRARIVQVSSLLGQNVVIQPAASNHNSLAGLQGGVAGEYYHLTNSEYGDFIGRSEVTSVSGSLLTIINSGDSNIQGQIDDIVAVTGSYALSSSLTNYSLLSTTASISGDLQGQINNKQNNITLTAGSNITIVESPTDTWTISASVSGGSSWTPLAGNGISISGEGSDYRFYQSQDDMLNIQEFTSSGTWIKPSGTWATVEVLLIGGGGGGSSGATSTNTSILGGSGGAGGNYYRKVLEFSRVPGNRAVTIGAGGAGGVANNTTSNIAGGAGGNSSFEGMMNSDNTSFPATGGGAAGATGASGNGPAGGSSSACGGGGAGGGPFTSQRLGGNGGYAWNSSSPGTSSGANGGDSLSFIKEGGSGGAGGSSGRAATFTGTTGGAGGYPGGGGGGGGSYYGAVTAYNGGAGGNGYCLVITRR